MASKIHHIELITRIATGSQLFVPPLTFDMACVGSAAHLVGLIRASGREAHLVAHPSWPQSVIERWPREWFLLPTDYCYHLKNRPESTWLWGISNTKQHSQELRNFLLGLKTIQVLDWTAERRKPIGDYIHNSPHLGGLTELSFTLAREVWPVHAWDNVVLGEALAAFFLRYPICCSDAPLVHMIQQLEVPVFEAQNLPAVNELFRQKNWTLHVYRELQPSEIDLLRTSLLTLFVQERATNLVAIVQHEDQSWEILNIHEDVHEDLRCRNRLKKRLPRAADGARFHIENPSLLLDWLCEEAPKPVIAPVLAEEIPQPEDADKAADEENDEDTAQSEENSEDAPDVKVEVIETPKVREPKEEKLSLEAWPYAFYLDTHFSFECSDPQWLFERDQRLEMMRDYVPEDDEDEEEAEEDEVELDWDASLLIRRLQALKLPPVILKLSDLKSAHLPLIVLAETDLKSEYEAQLDAFETRQQQRMAAHLENLRLKEIELREEKERIAREEQERIQREEAERIQKEEEEKAQREEAERVQREEAERVAREEAERIREEEEKARREEAERVQREEQERIEKEEAERIQKEEEERAEIEEAERIQREEEERIQREEEEREAVGADYLHQEKEGWGTEEKLEDEELLEHLAALEDQYDGSSRSENHYDDEEKLDDSEGIEHPSFDMFIEEDEEELSAEEILAQLTDSIDIEDDTEINEEEILEMADLAAAEAEQEQVEMDDEQESQEAEVANVVQDEVQDSQEIEVANADHDDVQDTQESADIHVDHDVAQDTQESADIHADHDEVQDTQESADVHADQDEAEDAQESADIQMDQDEAQDTQESADIQTDQDEAQDAQESADIHADHDVTQDAQESVDIQTDQDKAQDAQESADIQTDHDEAQDTQESADIHADHDEAQESQEPEMANADHDEVQDTQEAANIQVEQGEVQDTETIEDFPAADPFTELEPQNLLDSLPQTEAEVESVEVESASADPEPQPDEPQSQEPVIGRRGATGYINPYLWDGKNILEDALNEVRQPSQLIRSDLIFLAVFIAGLSWAWLNDLPWL